MRSRHRRKRPDERKPGLKIGHERGIGGDEGVLAAFSKGDIEAIVFVAQAKRLVAIHLGQHLFGRHR